MIEELGAAGLVCFAIASIAIGGRCLLLARRTRGVPELAIGLGFAIGAVVGYVPETIVLSTDLASPEIEARVLAITQLAIRFAAVAVMAFTLHVFRRREGWARVFSALILAALAVSWLLFPYTRVQAETPADIFWYDVFAVARSLPMAWGSLESFLYYRKARRRSALGLTDALLTNRFLLWSAGLGCMTLLMATTLFAAAVGVDPARYEWVLLESLVGMVGAVTLWLTFFPSRAYRVWIRKRTSTSTLDA